MHTGIKTLNDILLSLSTRTLLTFSSKHQIISHVHMQHAYDEKRAMFTPCGEKMSFVQQNNQFHSDSENLKCPPTAFAVA